MASILSLLRRQQPTTRKPCSRRLRAEQLEDRLCPAANLLVTTTIAATEQVLREFTPGGGADITDAQALGTIVNDDSIYQLSLNDAFGFEGDGASALVDFSVTLNQASTAPITVDYLTYAADATDHVDFVPSWGTLEFAPGETS